MFNSGCKTYATSFSATIAHYLLLTDSISNKSLLILKPERISKESESEPKIFELAASTLEWNETECQL